jgi:NAD(P)-dependent dehydrogenase (short-subunit alcohol dehydrogenase family)
MEMIDTLLDRSIGLGYGRTGLWTRRHLPGWPPDPEPMPGKVVLITGAASGIGLAACQGFARLGARVLAVARSDERAQEAAEQIRQAVSGAEVTPLVCDVSDLRTLRAFATRLVANEPRLDVLVNNAGVMPPERSRSADGHELTFATHVLAPFALTSWVWPLLERSAPACVINVSSGGMYSRSVPCDDPESEHEEYSPTRIYATTKREEVVITEGWAQRLEKRGVLVHSMHPGWADTKGVRNALPAFRALTRAIIRNPEQGADTIVWLGATAPRLGTTGRFWHDRRPRPTRYLLGADEESPACRQRLWDYCEAIIEGVPS